MTTRKIDKPTMFVFDPSKVRKRVTIIGRNGMEMRIGTNDAHRLIQTLLLLDPRWELVPADWRKFLIPKYQDLKGCPLEDHRIPKPLNARERAREIGDAIRASIIETTQVGVTYTLGDIHTGVEADYGTVAPRTISRHMSLLVKDGTFVGDGPRGHMTYRRHGRG